MWRRALSKHRARSNGRLGEVVARFSPCAPFMKRWRMDNERQRDSEMQCLPAGYQHGMG